jgi:sucrose-phosphate synthase
MLGSRRTAREERRSDRLGQNFVRMRIHLYSLHGLFRGSGPLEIGRDADNGGQIIYVMELARELATRPEVSHVDLFTRRIEDPLVGPDYARSVEPVDDKFTIRRVSCGGKKYLPKEALWDQLDEFVSGAVTHIKSEKVFPDWIHSHYADGGYVAAELSAILNVPFVHTGHSLGRMKLSKLLDSGMSEEEAERRFRFRDRFAAEETVLANTEFVITSTAQEVTTYQAYQHSERAEFQIIPPGLNLKRYFPYYEDLVSGNASVDEARKQARLGVKEHFEKFLSQPDKPVILCICRPDKKKNLHGLIEAYGTDRELQAIANLAIFAGIRSDIAQMPPGEKEVLTEILLMMDKYNLYGRLAIPKKHDVEWEVPEIYRLAALKKGVFVNIALTEPFGLTILEATASGLPVVATEDGGPAEILPKCQNGVLVPPTDIAAIQKALRRILTDPDQWTRYSNTGVRKLREHYSWPAHVDRYLKLVKENLESTREQRMPDRRLDRLHQASHLLASDIDGTLVMEEGEQHGLKEMKEILAARGNRFLFAVATGRSLEKVREVVAEHELPEPDIVIASVGTYIYYGLDEDSVDKAWQKHLAFRWNADSIREQLAKLPGLHPQEPENQNPFKVSFYIDADKFDADSIRRTVGRQMSTLNVIITQNTFLDVLPKRASKGRAVRYVCRRWSVPLSRTVVCGDSGNDLDLLEGTGKAVVVGNYSPELEGLRGQRRVYFSEQPGALGVLDGLRTHEFPGVGEGKGS